MVAAHLHEKHFFHFEHQANEWLNEPWGGSGNQNKHVDDGGTDFQFFSELATKERKKGFTTLS